MFVQISYSNVQTTDTPVDNMGTIIELVPTLALPFRQAVEIVNNTGGIVTIAQTSDPNVTTGTISLTTSAYDCQLATTSPKMYAATPSVRFFAFSDTAGNIRLLEYA